MASTDRTVSTASKAPARRDGPPTKTWSSSSEEARSASAAEAAVTTRSSPTSPVAGGGPRPASGRPWTWAWSTAPARASTSSEASWARSIERFSTAPSARTTTTSARRGPRPTSWADRMAADS